MKCNIEIAKVLIINGADIGKALIEATQNGRENVINTLLEASADVRIPGKAGQTCLMMAAEKGHTKIVKAFIDKGVDAGEPLIESTTDGKVNAVITLLKAGHVSIQDKALQTALMIAAQKDDIKIVKALIAKGPQVNIRSNQWKTAFDFAFKFGHANIVNALIGAGAQIDDQIMNEFVMSLIAEKEPSQDPLMTVILNSYDYIGKFLIDKGVDVNARHEGQTVSMMAARYGLSETINSLITKGADINAELKEGEETALTLLREELVLMRLVQSSETLSQKTKLMKEEDVRTHLNPDLISVIEKACPGERFSEAERIHMKELFQKVPVYKTIRENLLKAGGFDVQHIERESKTR